MRTVAKCFAEVALLLSFRNLKAADPPGTLLGWPYAGVSDGEIFYRHAGQAIFLRWFGMTSIQLLFDARATIAESLLWEPDNGMLFWCDIKAPALFRFDPRTGENRRWALPEDIGAFALREGGGEAVVALRSGVFALSLESGSLERIATAAWDSKRFRFNEGICDAAGRFWLGCMCDPPTGGDKNGTGPLQVWTMSAGLQTRGHDAHCHNGMAFSPDGSKFYMSHSMQREVFQYEYSQNDSHLGPARLLTRLTGPGIPDGAAVDEEGAYWCAHHGGGELRRYAPDGTLLRTMSLPVSLPTMCAFGGHDLRTLYISSASDQLSAAQKQNEPHAGSLFVTAPGVRGIPRPHLAR